MTPEIRILTVRQPWAGAIIHRGKDVENRSRNVAGSYRGAVAIHVALRHDYSAVDAHNAICGSLDQHSVSGYGAIIGVVDLVDLHRDRSIGAHGHCCSDGQWHGGLDCPGVCSTWADPGAWHLVLANPRPLGEPLPYRGALGLRRLPEDVAAAVWAGVRS